MFPVSVLLSKQRGALYMTKSTLVEQHRAYCTYFKQIKNRSQDMPIVSNKEFYF